MDMKIREQGASGDRRWPFRLSEPSSLEKGGKS